MATTKIIRKACKAFGCQQRISEPSDYCYRDSAVCTTYDYAAPYGTIKLLARIQRKPKIKTYSQQ